METFLKLDRGIESGLSYKTEEIKALIA